jgi:hypothetical protein
MSDGNFLGLILQHLPAAFQSVWEHQKKDQFCRDLYQKVVAGDPSVRHFKLHNRTLVYVPSSAKGKRYVIPEALRPMSF